MVSWWYTYEDSVPAGKGGKKVHRGKRAWHESILL